jgi:hypothetical protein
MILPLDDKEQRNRNGKLTPFEQKFNTSTYFEKGILKIFERF